MDVDQLKSFGNIMDMHCRPDHLGPSGVITLGSGNAVAPSIHIMTLDISAISSVTPGEVIMKADNKES